MTQHWPIQTRACRDCGCTETNACWSVVHGACWWVEDDLCSHCDIREREKRRVVACSALLGLLIILALAAFPFFPEARHG